MDKSKFSVSTYNKIAEKYTDIYFNDLSDKPIIDRFLSLLPSNAKILDIGCGPGNFTNYILKKNFHIEGIDLSTEMIKIATKKVPKCKFELMDMRKLKFPANNFDGLLLAYSLINIPSEEIPNTLKGFYRVLKSKGIMLIIAQNGEPDQIIDEPLQKGEKIFTNFFTVERLSKFLKDAGFQIEYEDMTRIGDKSFPSQKIIYMIVKKP